MKDRFFWADLKTTYRALEAAALVKGQSFTTLFLSALRVFLADPNSIG